MKDDPEFNLQFVSLVKENPCLYDFNNPDYNAKHVLDKVWESIARQVSESVLDCKDRWKNLRACYTRFLRHCTDVTESGKKRRRPYYLAEHLSFLQPFTKNRSNTNHIDTNTFPLSPSSDVTTEERLFKHESDDEAPPEEEVLPNGFLESSNECTNYTVQPRRKMIRYDDDSVTKQPKRSHIENISEDPDFCFLRSILPDMKEMSNEQKRRFKVGVLNAASEILKENKSPVCSSNSVFIPAYREQHLADGNQ